MGSVSALVKPPPVVLPDVKKEARAGAMSYEKTITVSTKKCCAATCIMGCSFAAQRKEFPEVLGREYETKKDTTTTHFW